jgi:transposase
MDKTIMASLPDEINNYISKLEENITNLTEQVRRLTELLRASNDALYGRSSEKTRYVLSDPSQLSLFNEAETYADVSAREETIITVSYTRKKKRTKEELARELPVVEEVIDLPEAERVCGICEDELRPIGKELVRREVCVKPAQAYIKEIYIINYSCSRCLKETEEANIVKPEPPVPVIAHGLASPSSVAYTIYQKYVNAMPLDRQEKDWANFGVQISRATLANWVINVSDKWLKPLYIELKTVLIESRVIHADETVVQVLHEPGKTPHSESRMWVYRTGLLAVQTQVILFEYQPDRGGKNPKAFLESAPDGFSLVTDGCASYNSVADAVHCGCWSHLRRKFKDALPPTNKEAAPAAKGFDFCQRLFALEDKFKDLPPEERFTERLMYSKPIVDSFFAWVDSVNPLSGSKFGTAITYARNQREPLSAFLLDGRVPTHNNAAENAIRPFVRGRVNWLFSDTVKGAEASAICYSIVETARANGINPYKYLNYLFSELPGVLTKTPDADLAQFFPWSDETRVRCRARDPNTGRLELE